jgi:diguanylate cyclase
MFTDILLGFVGFFSGMGVLLAYLRLTSIVKPTVESESADVRAASQNDAARTMMAAQQIRDLAENMACDVGAHQKLVAGYSEQLTSIRQAAGDPAVVFEEVLTGMIAANARLQERLEAAEQKIKAQADEIHSQQSEARSDSLTGLANRRAFDQSLAESARRLTAERRPFSLLLLDIDNFKQFNDIHGHLAGDEVLRCVGRTLLGLMRTGDVACRYGGEEFAVILAGATDAAAKITAERIRTAIERMPVVFDGATLQVTVSIGVTQAQADESESQAIRRADAAVYASKKAGRNMCHYQWANGCVRLERVAGGPSAASPAGGRRIKSPTAAAASECLGTDSFLETLSRRIAETHRSGTALSLLYFGIEDVAEADSSAASPAGTELSDAIGGVIRSTIREMDSLGRLGAGEFMVMLPGSSRSAAQIVAQRVKAAIASCPMQLVRSADLSNLRLGIADLEGMDEPLDIVERAKEDAQVAVAIA